MHGTMEHESICRIGKHGVCLCFHEGTHYRRKELVSKEQTLFFKHFQCRISTEEIVVSLLSIFWPFCHQRRFFVHAFVKMLYSSLSPCPCRSLCPRGVQIWEAKTKSKVYLHCSVIEKMIISCDFLVNFDKLSHCTASSVQGGR